MIGFIGAMDIEVDGLVALIENGRTESMGGLVFHRGTILGRDVVVSMCGVGIVNAAACTAAMIALYKPSEIIDIGVAGGLLKSQGMKRGDIVVSTGVVQHDMDVTPLGYAPGVVPDEEGPVRKSDEALTHRLYESAKRCSGGNVFLGVIASGNQFIGSSDRSAKIADTFGAAATEMEGAAVGYVCDKLGVPFCIMRSISDCADDDASVSYPEFCNAAAKEAIAIAKDYISNK